jgi:signal transduction histidine kinase
MGRLDLSRVLLSRRTARRLGEYHVGPTLRLRVRDDGAGIPQDILKAGRTRHYGLPGMRERANQIGAKLNIWSGVGAGTEIELSIPGSIAYSTSPGRHFRWFRGKGGVSL